MTERMALCVDGPMAGDLLPFPHSGFVQYADTGVSLPLGDGPAVAKPAEGIYHLVRFAFRLGDGAYTFDLLTTQPGEPTADDTLAHVFSHSAQQVARPVDVGTS